MHSYASSVAQFAARQTECDFNAGCGPPLLASFSGVRLRLRACCFSFAGYPNLCIILACSRPVL
jgi:hypothetical protein